MAEQLMAYEPGDRFVTMSEGGEAHIYEVAPDGRAYVSGYLPEGLSVNACLDDVSPK